MDELVTWLRAVLASRAETARHRLTLSERAGGAPWRIEMKDPLTWSVVRADSNYEPRAVLARVESDQRLVEAASAALREWPPGGGAWDHESETGRARSGVHEDVLRELAYGYRLDAPGFDQAWAPEGVSVLR